MKQKPLTWPGAGWFCLALALLMASPDSDASLPSPSFKSGAVYARDIVRDADGNPVYIYVEYNSEGEETGWQHPQSTDTPLELDLYRVMSATQYRALVQQYQVLVESLGDVQASEVLKTRSEFTSGSYTAADGSAITPPEVTGAGTNAEQWASLLREDTAMVVIAPQESRYSTDPTELVLLQLPIDPRLTIPPEEPNNPDENLRSLLLKTDETTGEVSIFHQSVHNIGFRVGFYGTGTDVSTSTRRSADEQIYGPLTGVPVSVVSFSDNDKDRTDSEGKYKIQYYLPSCPGFIAEFNSVTLAELHFKRFDPQGGPTRPYSIYRWDKEYCYSYLEPSYDGLFLNFEPVSDSLFSTTRRFDFPIDLMVLNGRAQLTTNQNGAIPLGETRFDSSRSSLERVARESYDLDGDGTGDTAVLGTIRTDADGNKSFIRTGEGETPEAQGVWLSSKNIEPTFDATGLADPFPDLTRLPDWSADFEDRALLSSISEEDLADTDLYVFRESDGTLLMERKGLDENERYLGVDSEQGKFAYTLRLVGSRGRLYGGDIGSDQTDDEFSQWQKAEGINDEALQKHEADHLRPGERVRIIAINRASGYLGSKSVELQAAGNNEGDAVELSFNVEDIQLAPPNLKVWAERRSRVQLGLTEGEIREHLIGNEGAGLNDDEFIAVYTSWHGPEGAPFPEELGDYGYTARLAKVDTSGSLVDSSFTEHFTVTPGVKMHLLRLPERVTLQHYYVQINAKQHDASFKNVGANGATLSKRPSKFVPFMVPLYDEELSNLAQQAIAGSGDEEVQPIYQWVYRPEFQFSIYEMFTMELNRTDKEGEVTDIIDLEEPGLEGGDTLLSLYYGLTTSENPMPDAYSYDDERELVFSLGEQEVTATMSSWWGQGERIEFDDLSQLAELNTEDYLVLSLYANNDAANILWEFELEYPKVILHSIAQGDASKGKRTVASLLDDRYFFTSLGHKKVFIYESGFGENDKVKVTGIDGDEDGVSKFDTYPAIGEEVPFTDGYAKFLLLNTKGEDIVTPNSANPQKAYQIRFQVTPDQSVEQPREPYETTASVIIKNNSNTSMEEVLAGKAVWVRNPTSIPEGAEDYFRGKTQHAQPGIREQKLSEQYVDYGQYLLNMVAIPLMRPVKESNFKYAVTPVGMYGPSTEKLIRAYLDPEYDEPINGFDENDRFFEHGLLSHHDNEQDLSGGAIIHLPTTTVYRTFRKVLQDYQSFIPASQDELVQRISLEKAPLIVPGLSYEVSGAFNLETFKELRYQIITPELMRGQVFNKAEGRTIAENGEFTDDDLGLYEMYLSHDWDGDGVSNLVEVENATLMTLNSEGTITNGENDLFNPLSSNDSNYAEILKVSTAAGFNSMVGFTGTLPNRNPSYSVKGPGLIVSGTQHVHGMRFPTFAPGIYDLGGTDSRVEPGEVNIDNYAVPVVVKIVEDASRDYAKIEADVYPLENEPAIHAAAVKQSNHPGFRMGMNDASIPGGGMVGTSNWNIALAERAQGLTSKHYLAHVSHQNGMDVDLRFMTNREEGKRVEKVVNFAQNPNDFDYDATLRLLQKIRASAHANGYRISKLFAGDTEGSFPSNLPPDLETGELRNFERFCDAVDLKVGYHCAETVKPHRHHIHLRFEPVNGSAYALQMPNQNHEVDITIPAGNSEATQTYSFEVRDNLGRPSVTYTRLHFLLYNEDGSMAANDNNGVVSVTVPEEYDSVLYVNPTNQVSSIGQAELSFTCYRSSDSAQVVYITGHPVPTSNVTAAALGTISINCTSDK